MNPSGTPSSKTQTPTSRVLQAFLPSPSVRSRLLSSGIVLLFLSACLGGTFLAASRFDPSLALVGSPTEVFLVVMCMLIAPLVVIILGTAAFREKKTPARAVMWWAAALLIGVAGLAFGFVIASDPDIGLDMLAVFLLVFVAPFVLLLSLPGIYYAAKAVPEIHAIMKNDLAERALGLIQAHGVFSFSDLALQAGISLKEIDNLVDGLIVRGQLVGTVYTRPQFVFTASALEGKQILLLEIIRARGQITLEALSRQLRVPVELVKDWIYQLVQRGQFSGYINWKEGKLYSGFAKKIGSESQCPTCGGNLSLAGAEIIRCMYCGSDVFR